ncbi:hypothetical protein AGMMS49944_16440 [Spirochaetia bacterium]|nr:hypothetical protein AGMMS49944_16440 [Spirochaetia bacterium]
MRMRSEEEVKKDSYLKYPKLAEKSEIKCKHDLIYFSSAWDYKADDVVEPEYYTLAQTLLTSIRSGLRFRYLGGWQGNKGNDKVFHTDIQELPDLSLGNYKEIVPSSRGKQFKDFAELVKPHFKAIIPGLPKELDQNIIDFVVKQKENGIQWNDTWGVWSFCTRPVDYMDYKFIYNDINKLDRGQFLTPEKLAKQAMSLILKLYPKLKYIWDPFCGNRGLLKYVPAGIITFGSDLFPVDTTITRSDFFRDNYIPEPIKDDPEHSLILSNPTFEDAGCDKTIDRCLKIGVKFGLFLADYNIKSRPLPAINGFYTNTWNDWPELDSFFGIPFVVFDPKGNYVPSKKIGDNTLVFVKPENALYKYRYQKFRDMKRLHNNKELYLIGVRIDKHPELLGRFPTQDDIDKYYDPKWEETSKRKGVKRSSMEKPYSPASLFSQKLEN